MITVQPHGLIHLCKTPLEADYLHQLTFASKQAQETYFNSVTQKSYSDYTYIRKDNQVKVNANIDEIINCNYMYYLNSGFTTKIYYCFITNMEYVSENSTLITFQTDVFQTWQFDIEYKQSFIEREHVNDDTIGLHTVPENLETGEYIVNEEQTVTCVSNNFKICFAVSKVPKESASIISELKMITPDFKIYNNVFSGYAYLACNDETNASNLIKLYDAAGAGEDIKSIFLIPKELYDVQGGDARTIIIPTISVTFNIMKSSTSSFGYSTTGNFKKFSIVDYIPKNNKLFTFPYVYGILDNNYGSFLQFNLEDISINRLSCGINMAISPGCDVKAIIEGYKNTQIGCNQYSLTLGKFPICSWTSNEFQNWLKQNSINIGMGLISDVGQIFTGNSSFINSDSGESGRVNKSKISGLANIGSTIGSIYKHSLVSPSINGNINVSNLNYVMKLYNPKFYQMSIKVEYAKIIDSYFSMFGYKVNLVKSPNITGRRNWNYVKTIDCNFDGDIPQSDLKVIKSIFNNGVTLWHSANAMYNYSLDNDII